MGAMLCCIAEDRRGGLDVCGLDGKQGNTPRKPGVSPRESKPAAVKSRDIDIGDIAPACESRPTSIASGEARDQGPLNDSLMSLEPETAAQHQSHVERLSLIADLLQSKSSGVAESTGGLEEVGSTTMLEGEEVGVAKDPPTIVPDSFEREIIEPEIEPENLVEQVERLSALANVLESRAFGTASTAAGESEVDGEMVAEREEIGNANSVATACGEAPGQGFESRASCPGVATQADRPAPRDADAVGNALRPQLSAGPVMQFGLATTFFLSHDVHRLRMSTADSGTADSKRSKSPSMPTAEH